MKVIIETIGHADQRYPSSGDWLLVRRQAHDDRGESWLIGEFLYVQAEPGNFEILWIRVSDLGDWKKEMLIAHHELTEALLCLSNDVDPKAVDAFDIAFEEAREGRGFYLGARAQMDRDFLFRDKRYADDAEPGDCPYAPYYLEHQFATGFERIMATVMDVDWTAYEEACNAL